MAMPKQHQAVLGSTKREFRSQFPLFPLGGVDSDVPSFQLHPVFAAISNRMPPNDAASYFVGPRYKS